MSEVIEFKGKPPTEPEEGTAWQCYCNGPMSTLFYITPRGCVCSECDTLQVFPTGIK